MLSLNMAFVKDLYQFIETGYKTHLGHIKILLISHII